MPWKTLNQLLGLAVIDQEFWQALQKDPLLAIEQHGFELTPAEQAIICKIVTNDLSEFSLRLMDEFGPGRPDKHA